jgi:hypothetical protein
MHGFFERVRQSLITRATRCVEGQGQRLVNFVVICRPQNSNL